MAFKIFPNTIHDEEPTLIKKMQEIGTVAHILTQNLYYNYWYQKSKYGNPWADGPLHGKPS